MSYHKNQHGFSHHFILPVLAFVAVGAIGAYVIAKSNAATAGPSDVVYSYKGQFRYSSANGTSTKYSSDIGEIFDVSQNQKWVLTRKDEDNNSGKFNYIAVSTTGEKISYGSFTPYLGQSYTGISCSTAATAAPIISGKSALFAKVSTTTVPKLYYLEGTIPCEKGKYNTKKITYRVYSIGANGTNKKAISTKLTSDGSDMENSALYNVATNGSFMLYTPGFERVISSTGKVLFKNKIGSYGDTYLSENGKKIVYLKDSYCTGTTYVADANGKNAKKVMSPNCQNDTLVTSISPTGTYLTYRKGLSNAKKSDLYVLRVSNKKSYKIDSRIGTDPGLAESTGRQERWLPGSNTLVYAKQDAKAKTVQILRTNTTGSNKKVLVSASYDKNAWYWFTIY